MSLYDIAFELLGIFSALIGGLAFGQWHERPGVVKGYRAIGVFFGAASIFCGACFGISFYEEAVYPDAPWIYSILAFAPPTIVWLFMAAVADVNNGGHIFWKGDDDLGVEPDARESNRSVGGNVDIKA